jgi:predicted Ser/Thr protein kinase
MEISSSRLVDQSIPVDNHRKVACFALTATVLGLGLIAIGLVGKGHHWGSLGTLAIAATWVSLFGGSGKLLNGALKKHSAEQPERKSDLELLGQGVSGAVYKTTWNGQTVALKKSNDKNEKEKEAFIKGMIFGTMGISCMVQHYDYIESPRGFASVMEYIDGRSLEAYLGEVDSLDDRMRILKSLLEGYKEMLEKGVLPGDLHPGNIMIDRNQNVRFIDFDHYLCIGMPTRSVGEYLIEFSVICKKIYYKFDMSPIVGVMNSFGLMNSSELASQTSPPELKEEVISALLAIVDSELQKLG